MMCIWPLVRILAMRNSYLGFYFANDLNARARGLSNYGRYPVLRAAWMQQGRRLFAGGGGRPCAP